VSRSIEDFNAVVQDLRWKATATLSRRERRETPEGETVVAALDPGIVGGSDPNQHRTVLQPHFRRDRERALTSMAVALVVA
jgi:hypothetical protein